MSLLSGHKKTASSALSLWSSCLSQGVMIKKRDVIGVRIGRLVVVKEVPPPKGQKERRFICKCDCGNVCPKRWTNIFRSDVSKSASCGCWNKEKKYKTKGTLHYRRLYNVWHKILYRCNNICSKDYHKYGARGIKVCDSWMKFENFYNDVRSSYRPGLTIERIDVNGDYKPDNCTWIRNEDQAKNRRTTVWIGGMCAKDFCKKHNFSYSKFADLRKKQYPLSEIEKIIKCG